MVDWNDLGHTLTEDEEAQRRMASGKLFDIRTDGSGYTEVVVCGARAARRDHFFILAPIQAVLALLPRGQKARARVRFYNGE